MHDWKTAARHAARSGAVASLLSAATLALCGYLENRAPAGPLNGPSQWIFGRRAAWRRKATLRHTLTGYLIHHASATGWALLHERVFGADKARQSFPRRITRAAVTAGIANVVDYRLTPKRLQPGFEAQLSKRSLFVVYATFALGLALIASRDGLRRRNARSP
jgi:hypothetical protein